jgi:hypothetical protein
MLVNGGSTVLFYKKKGFIKQRSEWTINEPNQGLSQIESLGWISF